MSRNEPEAYERGWRACMRGEDGRFTNPYPLSMEERIAWDAGFLDAMEAEDGEEADAAAAGFGGEDDDE